MVLLDELRIVTTAAAKRQVRRMTWRVKPCYSKAFNVKDRDSARVWIFGPEKPRGLTGSAVLAWLGCRLGGYFRRPSFMR